MDTTLITEGATLYLPVFHPGALFGLGDLHVAMGDREVCVSGIEIAGRVTITLGVIKNKSIRFHSLKIRKGWQSSFPVKHSMRRQRRQWKSSQLCFCCIQT
ncbi:acetamidase/formamidase family protein [Mesobacillus zeae]|nr:acetamidase/formamidase family protein [Mesobacillus zeae]